MRRPAVIAAVVAAALVSGACATKSQATRSQFEIKVSVTCFRDSVIARVLPSTVELNQTQEAVWVLTDASTASEFSIDKKKDATKKWPYGGRLPYKGKKGEPAKGDGTIWAGTAGKHGYSVSATCTPADGPIRSITIDPDIIIIWN